MESMDAAFNPNFFSAPLHKGAEGLALQDVVLASVAKCRCVVSSKIMLAHKEKLTFLCVLCIKLVAIASLAHVIQVYACTCLYACTPGVQ